MKKVELEEVFLEKREREFLEKLEKPIEKRNFVKLFFLCLLLLVVLLGRSFQLAILAHKKYQELALANSFKVVFLAPFRGIIYDRNLKPLIYNREQIDLVYEKIFEERKEIEKLAELFNLSKEELYKKIKESSDKEVLLLENLTHQQLVTFKAHQNEFFHLSLLKTPTRNYFKKEAFAHLLGYLSRIGKKELKILKGYQITSLIGRSGLEKKYEKELRGKMGKKILKRNAFGKIIEEKRVEKPTLGKNLVLYLDASLQEKFYSLFKEILSKFKARKGAGIIMDPQRGGILALVSFPSFDPNVFIFSQKEKLKEILTHPDGPLLNRAISGLYPTGSAIKPFLAMAGLNENLIDKNFTIYCQGFIKIKSRWMKKPIIFKDWEAHQEVDLKKAIAKSCNVFFYTLGGGYKNFKGLGPEKIEKYLFLFGFGQKTGIDLENEKEGLIPTPFWKLKKKNEKWQLGDTYNLSVGQGYLRVTPLQLAVATSALVNGGKILKPSLVFKITDEKGKVLKKHSVQIKRILKFPQEYFKEIKEGMKGAVDYGTAIYLKSLPFEIGAKTGTAQTSKEGIYHYWITLFAPFDDPQVVITILVEEVKGNINPAVRIAREILAYYFNLTKK